MENRSVDARGPATAAPTGVILGDCLEVMPTLDAESIDAINAALDVLAARVALMDFTVPRDCDCHLGQMRQAQEPDEYRRAFLAVIEDARP